jgi:hypothetical protein
MIDAIVENVATYQSRGVLACPITADAINEANFHARTEIDLFLAGLTQPPDLVKPKVNMWYTDTLVDSEDTPLGEARWVWGDTYPFRDWLGEETGTQPGGGIAKYAITTPAPGTDTPIKMAWAFDGSRTFDLSSHGGAPDASLAEFLAYKFGIEVTEHNDTWWEGGDGDDGA